MFREKKKRKALITFLWLNMITETMVAHSVCVQVQVWWEGGNIEGQRRWWSSFTTSLFSCHQHFPAVYIKRGSAITYTPVKPLYRVRIRRFDRGWNNSWFSGLDFPTCVTLYWSNLYFKGRQYKYNYKMLVKFCILVYSLCHIIQYSWAEIWRKRFFFKFLSVNQKKINRVK